MQKIILSEQALYYGDIKMPQGFEIDRHELCHYILHSDLKNSNFLFSKNWDSLNTYLQDHINLKYKLNLIKKETWGNIYKSNETTLPLINVNYLDLANSPDFTLLYGVNVEDCTVRIYYDDNRRKGNYWNIKLTNNKFIMFPSTNTYSITNNQKGNLNFIQTITYDVM